MESVFRIHLSHSSGEVLLKKVLGATNYTREKSGNNYGGFYWSRKLSGFSVAKKHDSTAYDWLMAIENSPERCQPVTVSLRKYSTAYNYEVVYVGEFGMNSAKFDLEKCMIEMDSKEKNIYTCIEKNKAVDFNMLSVEGSVISQYGTVLGTIPAGIPNGQLEMTTDDMTGVPGWFSRNINGPAGIITFWFRAVAYTECIGGETQEPTDFWPGTFDNWVLESECYDVNEQVQLSKYYQNPAPAVIISLMSTFMSYVVGCGDRAAAVGEFYIGDTCYTLQYNYGASANEIAIPNGRKLSAVLHDLFAFTVKNCTEDVSVKSNLFCINPDAEFESLNPVTGEFNYWKDPNLHEINDVKYYDADVQSSICIITFEKFMRDLYALAQAVWWIEIDGSTTVLRIEHISNALSGLGQIDLSDVTGYRSYTYDTEELANRKKFAMPVQRNIDFVGTDIFYEESCTNDSVEEISTSLISTDVDFITGYPEDAPSDGIVMLAVDDFGKCRIRPGGLTGVWQANASLGWAALHKAFYRHEANTQNGNLAGEETVFLSVVRNKKQDISVKDCNFNAEQNVTAITELGSGIIKQISINLSTRSAKIEVNL